MVLNIPLIFVSKVGSLMQHHCFSPPVITLPVLNFSNSKSSPLSSDTILLKRKEKIFPICFTEYIAPKNVSQHVEYARDSRDLLIN